MIETNRLQRVSKLLLSPTTQKRVLALLLALLPFSSASANQLTLWQKDIYLAHQCWVARNIVCVENGINGAVREIQRLHIQKMSLPREMLTYSYLADMTKIALLWRTQVREQALGIVHKAPPAPAKKGAAKAGAKPSAKPADSAKKAAETSKSDADASTPATKSDAASKSDTSKSDASKSDSSKSGSSTESTSKSDSSKSDSATKSDSSKSDSPAKSDSESKSDASKSDAAAKSESTKSDTTTKSDASDSTGDATGTAEPAKDATSAKPVDEDKLDRDISRLSKDVDLIGAIAGIDAAYLGQFHKVTQEANAFNERSKAELKVLEGQRKEIRKKKQEELERQRDQQGY